MIYQDLLCAIFNTIEGRSDGKEDCSTYFRVRNLRAVELLIIEKELAIRGYLLSLDHDKGTVLLQETELLKEVEKAKLLLRKKRRNKAGTKAI